MIAKHTNQERKKEKKKEKKKKNKNVIEQINKLVQTYKLFIANRLSAFRADCFDSCEESKLLL